MPPFIFEDFSSIKRVSSGLVDDVLAFFREGFTASAGMFQVFPTRKAPGTRPVEQ